MFLEERYVKILEILDEQGRISVKSLAQTFDVTEDSIRKYLKELEGLGKLKRVYGGAVPVTPYSHAQIKNVWERKNINVDSKKIIASKALSILEEGTSLFLDASTTNLEIAKYIAQSSLQLTVVTNMPDIALTLANHSNIQLIIIGGLFDHHIGGMVGCEANKQIQNYAYDKAFIGVCGLNAFSNKLSSPSLEDGYTKKTIIDHALEIYLVMEDEKFNYNELYNYSTLDRVTGIITESIPDHPIVDALIEKSIKLI